MNIETTTLNVLLVALIGLQSWIVLTLHRIDVRLSKIEARMGLTMLTAALCLTTGCFANEKVATASAARANVDFAREMSAGPPPAVTVSNGVVRISPPIISDSIRTTSASQDSASWAWEKKIPLGLSLILFGIGLLLALFALRSAFNASATGKALAASADQLGAKAVRAFRSVADKHPEASAAALSAAAEIEAARGRLP